jgi:4-diphosphocytidyl-2-C-methyl-D-erythritol kinase
MSARSIRVHALAKVNLDLRILYKRPDNYHELRTIFQTISLSDVLEIDYREARRTKITVEGPADIPDNLVIRAADACLAEMKVTAEIRFRLIKRIPMGAGLGGGSSDAGAVLLALPSLAGEAIPLPRLIEIGSQLGSDVPFFLFGGTAAGLGRGTELYPLPDIQAGGLVLVTPGIHVSTPPAYAALNRPRFDDGLTTGWAQNTINSFESGIWNPETLAGQNDFEGPVFMMHPELAGWKRRLLRLGAYQALMSGSGSSIFGLFRTKAQADLALKSLPKHIVHRVSLVSRARYRSLWRRWLAGLETERVWPPQNRYVR